MHILEVGPIIPTRIFEAKKDSEGNIVTLETTTPKPKSNQTDLDRTLYGLDFKAKSTIGNVVTKEVFSKIAGAKTAKAMWDFLICHYEGVTLVKTQRRINLIRNYENFAAGQNESLNDIHTRFQILINDLERVEIIKTQLEICQKFVDIIPSKFSEVVTSLKVSE